MALPDDLLEQAEFLSRRDGSGRPRQANLRRAVSAAYYALFHAVIEDSTTALLGSGAAQRPLRHALARTFDHGKMKQVCEGLSKGKWPTLLADLQTTAVELSPLLQSVCTSFVALQEQRHRADYNLARPFTRSEALRHVGRAKKAVNDWRASQGQQAVSWFVLMLLTEGKLRK